MSKYITIQGFEQLTQQQLFDMSVEHIAKTRRKSVAYGGSMCSYKGSGCAAAPFLRPETLELAGDVSWEALFRRGHVPEKHMEFVTELQACHDESPAGQHFVMMWKLRMLALAEKRKLSTAKLDAVPV